MIIQGDCVEKMREMDEASVDAVVCDPPYELSFMGRSWDASGVSYRVETWREALRILKPGGHLLAFGGTRTYHRLACAVEDADFEIRDSLIWLYGSGFPKSLAVDKAIDKAAGAQREVVGKAERHSNVHSFADAEAYTATDFKQSITAPATPEAAQWQGWGTALKPSHEPIVVARKPLVGTVAANVLEHGTGALNVDGCRVGLDAAEDRERLEARSGGQRGFRKDGYVAGDEDGDLPPGWDASKGRWPSNVVLSHLPECEQVGVRKVRSGNSQADESTPSEIKGGLGGKIGRHYADPDGTETIPAYECAPGCPVAALDGQSGELHTQDPVTRAHRGGPGVVTNFQPSKTAGWYDDRDGPSGASRFFYTAKASRAERNAGLGDMEQRQAGSYQFRQDASLDGNATAVAANVHPTVKPIDLMRWLVRLVTPPGGTVLDPFTGSGTTGIAAVLEGFDFIGIEREAEYVAIAEARIAWWAQFPSEDTTEVLIRNGLSERLEREYRVAGQLTLEGSQDG